MGRKRKQIDPDGLTKSTLPPCRVCDAPGAGFHYGANTCEACKGFFHRSLKLKSQYKCDGDGTCIIEHGRDKLCQACRYQKCLAVGMAKEAIKTGRYTSVKRTNDILEIKRLQEEEGKKLEDKSFSNHILKLLNQAGTHLDSGSDNSLDSTSQCSSALGYQSEQRLPGIMAHTGSTCQALSEKKTFPEYIQIALNKSAMEDIESLFSESSPSAEYHQIKQEQTQNLTYLSASSSPVSQFSPNESPMDTMAAKSSSSLLSDAASSLLSLSMPPTATAKPHGPLSAETVYRNPPSSVHSPASIASLKSPVSSLLSPAASSTPFSPSSSIGTPSSCASSSESHTVKAGFLTTVCDNCGCTLEEKELAELYQDKDSITQLFVEAYENFLEPLHGHMTVEEMKRQQLEHFEGCKLQMEMFGKLHRVPDQEYDYIFATTGLDMDDRQQRLRKMSAGLEANIRGMVKFAKVIPGFSKLEISDKVSLIKYSRHEFVLFSTYKFIDCDRKIIRGMDNQWKCENEITGFLPDGVGAQDFFDSLIRFHRSLQHLQLTDEEQVMIRAIVIMAPDRDSPISSPMAREIYWHLNECLIHLLAKRHFNPLFMYAKILGRITEARSQTENSIRFFRSVGLEKYSNLMDNPLLREMCAGIFFDCKDQDGSVYR